MKVERPMSKSGFQTFNRYLPSPETKQLILNYFKYNNFQDFNTWQQIARAKVDYQFHQSKKGFTCKVKLQWDDRKNSVFQQGQAKTKKMAKRKALTILINSLISQGFIARGFKDEHFIEKLPRRRKNASDESSEELQEDLNSRSQASKMVLQGNYQVLLNKVSKSIGNKYYYLYESWNFGLANKSLTFLADVLEALNGNEIKQLSVQPFQGPFRLPPMQIFDGTQVKESLPEDLTDFISPYQLQKELKPTTVRQTQLKVHLLPSEKVLIRSFTHSPSTEQFLEHFQPIQASKIYLKNNQTKKSSFLGPYQNVQVPKFEGEDIEVSIQCVELLYSLLLFYSQDYGFCLEVLNLLQKYLNSLSIKFKSFISQKQHPKAQNYYLKHKYLLTAQYLEVLSLRIANNAGATTIEGMIKPCNGQSHYYWFFPTQMEESVLPIKVKKYNLSEFQEAKEISSRQYVLLVSAFQGKWVGQICELSPVMKLHIPSLSIDEPHPVTLVRLFNAKLFEKTSSALIEASSKCMELFSDKTFLLWQPPTFPLLTVISELLIEWEASRQSVLIITPNVQDISLELTNLGFKVTKLTAKVEQKWLFKNNIVISNPAFLCCDVIRNYAYTRILIESAQAVSQISILSGIVKDCKQLWLIGDPYLPKAHVSSQLCKQKGMHISLFQRLLHDGKVIFTYDSKIENPSEHRNVVQWAHQYVYTQNLRPLGLEYQLSVIKGFPWPSYQYRVCFLHFPSFQPHLGYMYQCSDICSRIVEQVIKSGYTQPQQIICSTHELSVLPLLKWHVASVLRKAGFTEDRILISYLEKMTKMINGSIFSMSELGIFLAGSKSNELGDILGGLLQGRRGAIFIGDCHKLSEEASWSSFIGWCKHHNLICSFRC